jgi:predicted transcriptional regulator
MTFSEFIREKRQGLGISQDTVAHALDYSHRAHIHKLETGMFEWKLSSVIALAKLFDMTTSELLSELETYQ